MAVSSGLFGGALSSLIKCCLRVEQSALRLFGFPHLSQGPALAIQGPVSCPFPDMHLDDKDSTAGFLDNIFWMAAPKNRRTIEVNRCRRRNPNKLIEVKNNIDVCPECGHLKLKHVLCGFCYEKVREETHLIREEIKAKEGGPFRAPIAQTVVLYQGEKPRSEDEEKRIIERNSKRPSWFAY
ncbi:mitochondrial ribosomal protein L32 L homeolog [Xenopus laevis]|uniref:Large ribosomal subunit protein bL32m n=2 Tax=Xenopus laevis TaxID=8355 RepID=A7YYL7_XENLA|nr:mitochondrial ribosomal protein L32 L homeolog [Xenopus laevis]AAI52713.1 LOC100126616 protein [Xenopus laevis]AAI69363.1 Hypothetical protein LOC100126616 [Xenopus laevis]AAI69367.1 Hypothetical protein LOC100126616 [Xenopus laevis]OCT76001.1 hypothetical protein XELAEV_18031188mg [Xenopus laevis]